MAWKSPLDALSMTEMSHEVLASFLSFAISLPRSRPSLPWRSFRCLIFSSISGESLCRKDLGRKEQAQESCSMWLIVRSVSARSSSSARILAFQGRNRVDLPVTTSISGSRPFLKGAKLRTRTFSRGRDSPVITTKLRVGVFKDSLWTQWPTIHHGVVDFWSRPSLIRPSMGVWVCTG